MNKIDRDDIEELRESAKYGVSDLDLYQEAATKSAIYPGQGTPLGLVYVALKGAGEAGEFSEHVGKAMRDDRLFDVKVIDGFPKVWDSDSLTPERRNLLIKEIGDELWYLAAKCNELGIKLSEAAIMNLEKLADRQERGVLRGSGDNR